MRPLAGLGQSIWYDNICWAPLDHGDLQALVDTGVTGVTSNPSIFEKAIAGSADSDEAMGEQFYLWEMTTAVANMLGKLAERLA